MRVRHSSVPETTVMVDPEELPNPSLINIRDFPYKYRHCNFAISSTERSRVTNLGLGFSVPLFPATPQAKPTRKGATATRGAVPPAPASPALFGALCNLRA